MTRLLCTAAFLALAALSPPAAASREAAADTTRRPKRGQVAVAYAVGGTVLAFGLGAPLVDQDGVPGAVGRVALVGGYLFGPSLGNFYAEDFGRGLAGAGLRLGGGLLLIYGFVGTLDDVLGGTREHDGSEIALLGGMVVVGGSMVWNVVTAPRSVRAYNARHRLVVVPLLDGRTRAAGLSFTYRL